MIDPKVWIVQMHIDLRWGDWRKHIHFLRVHTWLPMYPLYFPDGSANGLRCMYCKLTRRVSP